MADRIDPVERGGALICDRCGLRPREVSIFGRDLCGDCYCRYASELVKAAQARERTPAPQPEPRAMPRRRTRRKGDET